MAITSDYQDRDDETAPLNEGVSNEEGRDREDEAEEDGEVPPLPALKMLALTCSIGGLQFVWSTLLSNGSLYLLSLGITKAASALIWAAPPLCGTIVQPYIGVLSDQSRNPYGRRRPFIIGGAISCIVFLVLLAWCGVLLHSSFFEKSKDWSSLVVFLLVLGLSVSIQPLQFGTRALILDVVPPAQQPVANAWAGRWTGGANIVGFFLGSLTLPKSWPQTEAMRFQMLTVITAVLLTISVVITCWAIKERNPRRSGEVVSVEEARKERSVLLHLKSLVRTARGLPKGIRRICEVQFVVWMGWFVFLYYSSTYVASIYDMKAHTSDEASAGAVGTRSSLTYALVSFATSILAPLFASFLTKRSHLSIGAAEQMYKRFWIFGHLLFSATMLAVSFVRSATAAIALIGVLGVSWAITSWIPFTLLGIEITSQIQRHSRTSEPSTPISPFRDPDSPDGLLDPSSDELPDPDVAIASRRRGAARQSGTILAIHNAAISGPQILAALGCSLLFYLTPQLDTRESIEVVLRLASGIGVVAAWLVWRWR